MRIYSTEGQPCKTHFYVIFGVKTHHFENRDTHFSLLHKQSKICFIEISRWVQNFRAILGNWIKPGKISVEEYVKSWSLFPMNRHTAHRLETYTKFDNTTNFGVLKNYYNSAYFAKYVTLLLIIIPYEKIYVFSTYF